MRGGYWINKSMLLSSVLILQACSGGDSNSVPIPTVASVTVLPSTASIEIEKTQAYTAVVKDTNGNILNGVVVTWESEDTRVATIDSDGLAQGHSIGFVRIVAKYQGISSQLAVLSVIEVAVTPLVSLPPWLTYCENKACDSIPPVISVVCPIDNQLCNSSRSTNVITQVNGVSISGISLAVIQDTSFDGLFVRDKIIRHISGDGEAFNGNILLIDSFTAPFIKLQSDEQFQVSFYGIDPQWGSNTIVNFTARQFTASLEDTLFFHHPSYTPDTSPETIHNRVQEISKIERDLTGIVPAEHVKAYFLPTDLATSRIGEGNFSFGEGTITVHYGHPHQIVRLGGIAPQVLARYAHEYSHELFSEISGSFLDNPRCLNEGLADFVGFASGYLPEVDFGPIGLRGLDFRDGCLNQISEHDIGNCYTWHLKQAGFLTPTVIQKLFHPQHTFVFDSCVMDVRTGNSLLVYFTEATKGANMIPVLNKMGLPHAVSYAEAKKALNL